MLISNPSHSFWIVATPALFVLPFTMSLTVDCVTPEIMLTLLMVMLRYAQSSYSRFTTASEIVMPAFLHRNTVGFMISIRWRKD